MSNFADSSSVQIGYIEEATFGVTPASGNYKRLRVTGESLDYAVNKEASAEISDTRGVSSMIILSESASGALNTEVSYKEYDDLLAATLQSVWSAYGTNGVGTSFVGTFTATTITAGTAPTSTSAFTTLKRGQFFSLVAAGSANSGKIFRVSESVAPTSTVITLHASTPAAVEASVAGCVIRSSRLTHGSTQKSFSIERQSSDVSEYWVYKGMTPGSMSLTIGSNARTTMSFNFMGKTAARKTGSSNLPGTAIASAPYDIHSGVTGPACILHVNGAPLVGTFVRSFSLSFDNALGEQLAICAKGPVGMRTGTIKCTGSMEVYFKDGDHG
jgi:hypothetical protein